MLTNCSKKCAISNKAINMHSRGPIEQYFCVLEPHHGCLHKVKKMSWYPPLIKEGQRSHNIGKWSRTPMFYTTGRQSRQYQKLFERRGNTQKLCYLSQAYDLSDSKIVKKASVQPTPSLKLNCIFEKSPCCSANFSK